MAGASSSAKGAVPKRFHSALQAWTAPGTVTASQPRAGILLRPRSARARRAGRAARAVQAMQPLAVPDQREGIAADAVHRRLDHELHGGGGDRGVDALPPRSRTPGPPAPRAAATRRHLLPQRRHAPRGYGSAYENAPGSPANGGARFVASISPARMSASAAEVNTYLLRFHGVSKAFRARGAFISRRSAWRRTPSIGAQVARQHVGGGPLVLCLPRGRVQVVRKIADSVCAFERWK